MKRSQQSVLADIEAFEPQGGNWLGLEALLTELWFWPITPEVQWVLLGVFDRFPGEHGGGVFWSIVHGLESVPGYEHILLESASRQPAELKNIMIQRHRKSSGAQQGIQRDGPAFGGPAR